MRNLRALLPKDGKTIKSMSWVRNGPIQVRPEDAGDPQAGCLRCGLGGQTVGKFQ